MQSVVSEWDAADTQWKGTLWEPDSGVWETTTDNAMPAMFGNVRRQECTSEHEETILLHTIRGPGVDQVQLRHGSSYDGTTCGTFGGPSVAQGGLVHRCEWGQDITNIGRAKFQTVKEFGKKRKMEGHVTEVHEPLSSASEISMYNDSFIFEKFGALIPQTQPSCRRSTTRVSSTVSTSLLS